MTPIDYRTTDKDSLLLRFQEEGWAEKLLGYQEDTPQIFGRKTIRVWRDADGDVKCRLLEYNNPTGRQEVVRQLMDDDGIMWYIP